MVGDMREDEIPARQPEVHAEASSEDRFYLIDFRQAVEAILKQARDGRTAPPDVVRKRFGVKLS